MEDLQAAKIEDYLVLSNKIWTNCGDKVLNVDIKAANVSQEHHPQRIRRFAFRWDWGIGV